MDVMLCFVINFVRENYAIILILFLVLSSTSTSWDSRFLSRMLAFFPPVWNYRIELFSYRLNNSFLKCCVEMDRFGFET